MNCFMAGFVLLCATIASKPLYSCGWTADSSTRRSKPSTPRGEAAMVNSSIARDMVSVAEPTVSGASRVAASNAASSSTRVSAPFEPNASTIAGTTSAWTLRCTSRTTCVMTATDASASSEKSSSRNVHFEIHWASSARINATSGGGVRPPATTG